MSAAFENTKRCSAQQWLEQELLSRLMLPFGMSTGNCAPMLSVERKRGSKGYSRVCERRSGVYKASKVRFRSGSPHLWLRRFNALVDFDPSKDRLDDKLKVLIPLTDAETRQRMLLVIETVLAHATRVAADEERYLQITNSAQHRHELEMNVIGEARAQAKAAQTGLNFKLAVLHTSVGELGQLEKQLVQRVDLFEQQLPIFRREIERYFES